MGIGILLVDDFETIRCWLRELLRWEPGMAVIGECGDGASAVLLSAALSPDVVLMDISLPGMNGIEATRWIAASEPGCRVLALSGHEDRKYVEEMRKAGASGYLLKDHAASALADAIRGLRRDRFFLGPGLG